MIRYLLAVSAVGAALTVPSTAAVSAEPASAPAAENCSNVRLVYARGTDDDPGLGPVGDDLRHQLRLYLPEAVSFTDHPVDYPATKQWATAVEGMSDARADIVSTVERCPDTKIVLGGYSQGAAVAGFVTTDRIPDGVDPATVPQLLPVEMASHIAAVVLLGPPNNRAMDFLHQPMASIGPAYSEKTRVFCAAEDPICSDGLNFGAHAPSNYIGSGLADAAARFAAAQVGYPVGGPAGDPHLGNSAGLPGPA